MTFVFSEPAKLFTDRLTILKKSNPQIVKKLKKFIEFKEKGEQLPNSYKDHSLSGDLLGCSECHLSGNILLVYKTKNNIIKLLAICNHDELYNLSKKIDIG